MLELDSGERFRIDSLLGEGAVGVVFRCYRLLNDSNTNGEAVAVKVLLPLRHVVGDQNGYERIYLRFVQESKRPMMLKHGNLVEIVGGGSIVKGGNLAGQPVYVMENIDGGSLEKLFQEDPPDLSIRLQWVIELGEVLMYLHENGILHRDIKPANILISKTKDKIYLSDYGVIRWGEFASEFSDGIATYSSERLTTWNYLPPETEDEPSVYDEAAEAWCYGKTAAEILAWNRIPRGNVLTGKFDPSQSLESSRLGEGLTQLLHVRRHERGSLSEGIKYFREYLKLYTDSIGLPDENIDKAYAVALRFISEDSYHTIGEEGLSKWFSEFRKDRNPDRLSPNVCPSCGSGCTLRFHYLDYSDGGSDEKSICLGQPDSLCASVWNHGLVTRILSKSVAN